MTPHAKFTFLDYIQRPLFSRTYEISSFKLNWKQGTMLKSLILVAEESTPYLTFKLSLMEKASITSWPLYIHHSITKSLSKWTIPSWTKFKQCSLTPSSPKHTGMMPFNMPHTFIMSCPHVPLRMKHQKKPGVRSNPISHGFVFLGAKPLSTSLTSYTLSLGQDPSSISITAMCLSTKLFA